MYKKIRLFFENYTKIYRERFWFQKISGGKDFDFREKYLPLNRLIQVSVTELPWVKKKIQ